jgi:general secretion pathway protein G
MLVAWLALRPPVHVCSVAQARRVTRRQAGRRRHARGVTPLELAVAVAATVLLGVVVAFVVRAATKEDSERMAEHAAERILTAAEQWQQEHATGCPTISQLVHDRALDADARVDDPWGSRYRVVCSGPELTVRSSGKDGETGTADDIRVPRS